MSVDVLQPQKAEAVPLVSVLTCAPYAQDGEPVANPLPFPQSGGEARLLFDIIRGGVCPHEVRVLKDGALLTSLYPYYFAGKVFVGDAYNLCLGERLIARINRMARRG